jgi:hypothetical protein
MARLRLQWSDYIAAGCWIGALIFIAIAAAVGPEGGACDRGDVDAQVSSSRIAGVWLFLSALAMTGAAASLVVGAIREHRRAGKIARALTALGSLASGCLTGFFALLAFVAFQCLE